MALALKELKIDVDEFCSFHLCREMKVFYILLEGETIKKYLNSKDMLYNYVYG